MIGSRITQTIEMGNEDGTKDTTVRVPCG